MVGHDGRVAGVLALELGDGVIVAIHSVVNPDKLGRLGLPVGSLRDLLRPPGNAAGN
jgi:RNA polymerase sigma-70 factor (ECF subfamily)